MKTIFKTLILLALAFPLFTSCKMDVDLHHNKEVKDATSSPQDIKNIMNGAFNQFASYRFYGRDYILIGDISGGISTASPNYGWFMSYETWTFADTESELNDLYSSGFVVIDACTRGIKGAKELIAAKTKELETAQGTKKDILMEEIYELNTYLPQFYSLKAFTYFCLSNLFAKCYAPDHLNDLGLVLVKDETIEPNTTLHRSTVKETYDYILELIGMAEAFDADYFDSNLSPTTFNPVNIKALKARVLLYMRDYEGAKTAADEVIAALGDGALSANAYIGRWHSTALDMEDLFTLPKSDIDNLSANSLNTMYSTYNAGINFDPEELFGKNDFRAGLIDFASGHPMKFDGTRTSQVVTNIPVIRKSEVFLIAAEAKAQLNDINGAYEALNYTASRDASFAETQLTTKEQFIDFIANERIREFFQEGHRWYDLRRMDLTVTLNGVENYRPSEFVFPIPASEINAGQMTEQNPDWKDHLPK